MNFGKIAVKLHWLKVYCYSACICLDFQQDLSMRKNYKNIVISSCYALMLFSPWSMADDVTDISKLLRAGQFNEAMQKTDVALTQRPKDAQLRFLKGLILTEQNKVSEAITVFNKLSEDHPELPEPYNNLAVLYAGSGQYDKARAALEMAIRTNPTYSTAHENLGDVYAKLASQSYDKALQLDSGNSTAKLKLTLVKNLVGNTTGGTNPKTATASASAVTSKQTAPATTKPEPEVKLAEKNTDKVTKPDTKAKIEPADKAEEDVMKAVEAWADAWSNKETQRYLHHYAKDFQTPKGESYKAWAEDRKHKIEGKGHINVKIEQAQISVEGNTATVKFRQIYKSDQLTANSRKTLNMIKQDGKWLIKQERSGS